MLNAVCLTTGDDDRVENERLPSVHLLFMVFEIQCSLFYCQCAMYASLMYLQSVWINLGILNTPLKLFALHLIILSDTSYYETNEVFTKCLASSTITQISNHFTSFLLACVCTFASLCTRFVSLATSIFFPLNGEENSHLHTPLEQSGSCLADFIVRS